MQLHTKLVLELICKLKLSINYVHIPSDILMQCKASSMKPYHFEKLLAWLKGKGKRKKSLIPPYPFPLLLSPASGVRSKREIKTRANDFVGFRNLMQMSRLTTRVHHEQAPVFQPEICCMVLFSN